MAKKYFEKLFEPKQSVYDPVIATIRPCIFDSDKVRLLAPLHVDEFKNALLSMDMNKSPGPDGLNPSFYRKFWDICGAKFFEACCQ